MTPLNAVQSRIVGLVGFPETIYQGLGSAQSGERLSKWANHECHATAAELITRVSVFANTINRDPFTVADRLWTRTTLDPEEEKLRIPC